MFLIMHIIAKKSNPPIDKVNFVGLGFDPDRGSNASLQHIIP